MSTKKPYSFKTRSELTAWKRKHPLLVCDSNGKMLYPGDYVRIATPMCIKSSWCSMIYWTMVGGAVVSSHPTHIAMEMSNYTSVSSIVEQMSYSKKFAATMIKITKKEYLAWKREHDKKINAK